MSKLLIMAVILVFSLNIHASYFKTDRPQKIFGSFLTDPEQINEVIAFSNAFGAAPRTADEITQYLDANVYKMLPVIAINHFLFDQETGMYHDDVSTIVEAIEKSSIRTSEILFLMDEPLWWVRNACEEGKADACGEVESRYVGTLSTMRVIGQLLRKQFPGSGVIHIEAWAELVLQKQTSPHESVIILDDAEYVGFNCYGHFDSCGSADHGYNSQIAYGTWVWDAMHALESTNPIGRKLFLVPASFLADQHFDGIQSILDQMAMYAQILRLSDWIGGFGVFLWGDMTENNKHFAGARTIYPVANFLAYIANYFGIRNNEE